MWAGLCRRDCTEAARLGQEEGCWDHRASCTGRSHDLQSVVAAVPQRPSKGFAGGVKSSSLSLLSLMCHWHLARSPETKGRERVTGRSGQTPGTLSRENWGESREAHARGHTERCWGAVRWGQGTFWGLTGKELRLLWGGCQSQSGRTSDVLNSGRYTPWGVTS